MQIFGHTNTVGVKCKISHFLQISNVVMMSKRKARSQLKVAISKYVFFIQAINLQVPRSSLPTSPIHGQAKNKLKKAMKTEERSTSDNEVEENRNAEKDQSQENLKASVTPM